MAAVAVLALVTAGCRSSNEAAGRGTKTADAVANPIGSRRAGSIPASEEGEDVVDPGAEGAKPPSAVPAMSSSSACRPDPLANVYHPSRLKVIVRCVTVSGHITMVHHENDGDYHVNVAPDPAFAGLLNKRNVSEQANALVTEIVPADAVGCTPGQAPRAAQGSRDYGICTGAALQPPPVGTWVDITGPYVLDTVHGWMEIHPVWAIATRTAAPSPSP